MTPPCCMCGAPVTTMGWSVCDKCHAEGAKALQESRKPIQRHMLQFDERERIYKPVPIPQYERGDA
jgi:hypothetical protein